MDGGCHGKNFEIDDLVSILNGYLDRQSVAEIYRAYLFSEQAHKGQRRKTGEAYIYHPLAVAQILAHARSDTATVKAALLHDVLEDTQVGKDELEEKFGAEVVHMVDGVSKLDNISCPPIASAVESQHENFRKMMLAMTGDIRVIVIKLADRLHNMRTLYGMKPVKQKRIAEETMQVYVPIARRIGMYGIMLELEDLAFQNIYPFRRRVLEQEIAKRRAKSAQNLQELCKSIGEKLDRIGITVQLKTREKSLYSIYRKMRNKELSFAELTDVYALRIITSGIDDCYRCLGVVHTLYKPVPGEFKDYIAIPKNNGYQSLHTVLFLAEDYDVEIQIRTRDMDEVAESGIASHWRYKSGDAGYKMHTGSTGRNLIRQVEELQESSGDSREFMESLKVDLISDNVYVFTPKGKIMELPRGATALDFAYAVHTDIGSHCHKLYINDREVSLGEPLRNGQTVRIETDPAVGPLPSWLNFVATGRARSNIRNSLRKLQRLDAIKLGKRMLENSLKRHGIDKSEIKKSHWKALIKDLNAVSADKLYESIGQGSRLARLVVKNLMERTETSREGWLSRFDRLKPGKFLPSRRLKRADLQIRGTEGMSVNYAKCCYPLPGDNIIGFVMSGRGIVVHKNGCKNLKRFDKYPEKLVDLQWHDDISGEFDSSISLKVINRPGTLARVAATISSQNSNIVDIDLDSQTSEDNVINMIIKVTGRKHLADIVRALKVLKMVKKIRVNA